MLDAIVLSDIHLGSDNCQAKNVCRLLEQIVEGELATSSDPQRRRVRLD